MTWLFTLVAMAVIAVVTGVVTGRISGSMELPVSSLPFRGLPADGVRPADVEQLRFDAALRGYRMDEVDGVLDRLAQELAHRDEEIAMLRAELAEVRQGFGEGDEPQPAPSLYPTEDAYGHVYTPPSGGFGVPGWPERGQD